MEKVLYIVGPGFSSEDVEKDIQKIRDSGAMVEVLDLAKDLEENSFSSKEEILARIEYQIRELGGNSTIFIHAHGIKSPTDGSHYLNFGTSTQEVDYEGNIVNIIDHTIPCGFTISLYLLLFSFIHKKYLFVGSFLSIFFRNQQ